jgi:N-acetylmuramoyl-L-alanine amidase
VSRRSEIKTRNILSGLHSLRPVLCLLAFLFAAAAAPARTTPAKLDKAREYFDKAKENHAALERVPASKRTEKDYAALIEDFRRVYLTAPTYGNATICLMAIGELAEEAARRFSMPRYFETAVDSYEFLLKEYPNSQFRFEALLSVARIHRQDLQQPAKALETYERYLKKFPNSAQARQVEVAVAALKDEIGSQPVEEPAPAASAPPEESAATAPKPEPAKAAESKPVATAAKATPVAAQPAAKPVITSIGEVRFWKNGDYTRVVLDTGKKVKYDVGRVESPARLYLDLLDTRVSPASGKTYSVGDEILRSIRVAQFKPGTSRVVLDLKEGAEFLVSELTNPDRLVIDVRGAKPVPAGAPVAAAAAPEAQAPAAERAAREPAPERPNETPAARTPGPARSEPVQVAKGDVSAAAPAPDKIKAAQPLKGSGHSLTRALGLKIGRILIDPGHGGHDTGTIGPSGFTEKELVLDVSRRLGKLIEEQLGSEVVYTRDIDEFVGLEDRGAMANQMQADLFISIHANSSRSKTASGIETYYLSLTSDPEALEVAARENAVSQETISELQGLVRKIALHEKVDESKEFAAKVHAALKKSLAKGRPARFDRGVKKAPFVVLIGANMPAILAEVSFLSNPEEEKRLKTPEHRQKIAEALYAGVAGYADTLSGIKTATGTASSHPAEPTHTASLD